MPTCTRTHTHTHKIPHQESRARAWHHLRAAAMVTGDMPVPGGTAHAAVMLLAPRPLREEGVSCITSSKNKKALCVVCRWRRWSARPEADCSERREEERPVNKKPSVSTKACERWTCPRVSECQTLRTESIPDWKSSPCSDSPIPVIEGVESHTNWPRVWCFLFPFCSYKTEMPAPKVYSSQNSQRQ